MKYSEVYGCDRCPVAKYCGTMVSTFRLCNSCTITEEEAEKERINAAINAADAVIDRMP